MTITLDEIVDDVTVDAPRCRARVRGTEVVESSTHDLNRVLTATVYRLLHSGGPEASQDPTPTVDWDSVGRLAGVTRSRPLRRVVPVLGPGAGSRSEVESTVVVLHQGVRVAVPRTRVLERGTDTATVAFADIRPAVSPGFFLLDRGLQVGRDSPGTFRLYIHVCDFTSAVSLWPRLTDALDATGCRYQAKVLAHPSHYPRRDAIVVYAAWPEGAACLAAVVDVTHGSPGLGDDVSEFTRAVSRGVALGWEPADPRPEMTGLSLGQHRSTVISRALIEASTTAADPADQLTAEMRAGNVLIEDLYCNADSPRTPHWPDIVEDGAGRVDHAARPA